MDETKALMQVPFRGSRPRSGSMKRRQLSKANLNPDALDERQVKGFFQGLGYPELNVKLPDQYGVTGPDSYVIRQELIDHLNQSPKIAGNVAVALRDVWHSDNFARCSGPVPPGILRIFISLIPKNTQAEIAKGMMLAAQMNLRTLHLMHPTATEVDCEKEVEDLLVLNAGLSQNDTNSRATLLATRQNTLELQDTKNALICNVSALNQICTETLTQLTNTSRGFIKSFNTNAQAYTPKQMH